jgi:myo-inositol-1(or 4)-monophosphatase
MKSIRHRTPPMPRLDFCRQLARQAGVMAHTGFGTAPASLKGRHDVLTEMDGQVERFVRAAITAAYPADAIIGEEDGGAAGERVWIIDPIDGTANYARGIAHYCVSIGYVEHGVPVIGAIFDPSHDRLYSAERGAGAWLDEGGRGPQRMAVSPVANLHAASVECGWSLRRPTDDYLALVARVMHAGCAMRRAGSGALGLCDVAAGRIEAYAELHINAWDCAAGVLLVTEAGGHVNDFFAGDGLTAGNVLVASNHALRAELGAVLAIAELV